MSTSRQASPSNGAEIDVAIEAVPCPACGAERRRLLHAAVDRWMGGPGVFRYAACLACGQVYLYRRPAVEALGRYYPPDYIRVGRGPAALRRWFRRRDLAPRVRLTAAQPGRRVLDVGCARGDFLRAMRARGWIVAGVEPTPWAAEQAAADGLPVWPTTLGAAALPSSAFDVATLWDVLEHLPAPRADLERLARALRPRGRLLVTTPVLDGWEARRYGRRWPGWDTPRHLTVFSRATLTALLEASGFRVLGTTWISESYLITAHYLGLLAKERLPGPMASAVWHTLHARPVRLAAAPLFRTLDRRLDGCALTVVAERRVLQSRS